MNGADRPRIRPKALLALLAMCTLLFAGPLAGRAEAHATLQETSPGDGEVLADEPSTVTIRFDEPVEVLAGGIEVFDPDGRRVDEGVEVTDGGRLVATGLSAGGQGTYTVAWRVVSGDSHNLAGSFVFHVGRETGSVGPGSDSSTVASFLRWLGQMLGLAGVLVVVGAPLVCWRTSGNARRRAVALTTTAAALSALGWLVALAAYAAELAGRELTHLPLGTVADVIVDTRAGGSLALRAALMAASSLLFALLARANTSQAWLVPMLAGVAVLVATSLSGHAWTASPQYLAVGLDVVHVIAAAVWIGGLVALIAVMPVAEDSGLISRFSTRALAAAVAVGLAGSASAWIELPAIEDLWTTGYGRLILGKALGFAVLMAFGWRNRSLLASQLEDRLPRLATSIRAEIAVAAAVLALTATLIGTPPPEAASGPASISATADGARLDGVLDPATVGSNNLHLYFYDEAGAPLTADAVEITVGTDTVPPRRVEVTPITPSHVSALNLSLPIAGTWELTVTVIAEGVPTLFELEVQIP